MWAQAVTIRGAEGIPSPSPKRFAPRRRELKFSPRAAVAATAVLAAVLLSCLILVVGCRDQDRYGEDLRYGVRTDPLVLDHFTPNPPALDKPGDFGLPGYLYGLPDVSEEEKNKKLLDPNKLSAEQRQKIEEALVSFFGSPRDPRVTVFKDVDNPDGTSSLQPDAKFNEELQVDDATLARGSALFRVHCLNCHGVSGNGRGITAAFIQPHPRDFRRGKFKFISIKSADESGGNERKPSREDLLHVLRIGVDHTGMNSYELLGDDNMNALASYVIHLSIRGEVEFLTIKDLLTPDSGVENIADQVKTNSKQVADWWRKGQDKANWIMPGPDTVDENNDAAMGKSVKRGFDLFQKKAAGCIACHVDYGRQGLFFYDDWGTVDRPADLTSGVFRGGRAPIDLYYRIHSGINGANMPGVGKQDADEPGLTAAQIWDLVHFLEILPYPHKRQKFGIDIDHSTKEEIKVSKGS